MGTTTAYWALLVTGTSVNLCTDRFWSFARATAASGGSERWRHRRPAARWIRVMGAAVLLVVPVVAARRLEAFIVVVSVLS